MKEYRSLGAEHSSAKQEPPVFDDFPPVIGFANKNATAAGPQSLSGTSYDTT